MKKLFLGSVALTMFSISILIFQISCKKESTAQPLTNQSLNKILYTKVYTVSGIEIIEYWTSNTDGSNAIKIPITPPTGLVIGANGCSLTPDGTKLIFTIYDPSNNRNFVYSCLLNGSNMTKLAEATTGQYYQVHGSY
jgi:hypothetical protein